MHYKTEEGYLVKSENAALSVKQSNRIITKYISDLPSDLLALDYGCGKLRHSIPLYSKCKHLTLVDSEIQINRTQMINERKTSIIEYVKNRMPKAKVCSINDESWMKSEYDFILCSNVLSTIPSIKERLVILKNIRNLIKTNGKALISVQYRNSYFNTYSENSNAQKYLDGWLIKKGSSYSFYGLIKPEELIKLCGEENLNISRKINTNGSIYLEVCY